MDPVQLRELVAELRKLGVTHYKTLELELDLGLPPPEPIKRMDIVDQDEERKKRELEEENYQFGSSEGFRE